MRFRVLVLALPLVGLLLLVNPAGSEGQEGHITGRVSLADMEGSVFYGDWVRVFLTTEALVVPVVDLESATVPLERRSRINTGHMDFLVAFQQKQNGDGDVVDHKLTRPDGTFAFHGILTGRYWVVITFPTMIAGFKCAWQAEVELEAGANVHVELNNENLVVPAY